MQRDATQLGIAVDLMNRIEARYNFVRDLLREHSDDDELVSEYTRALWCELVDLSDAWHELNSDLADLNDEHELNSQRELESELGPEEQEEDQCLEGPDDLD